MLVSKRLWIYYTVAPPLLCLLFYNISSKVPISHYYTANPSREDVARNTTAVLTKTALIKIENKEAFLDPVKRPSHYYVHIPKAGGGYASRNLRILARSANDEIIRETNETREQRPCNVDTKRLRYFRSLQFPDLLQRVKCNMWISEQPTDARPNHTYTIIRSPKEHVISQYHHCTESKDHQFANKMPSFDEWIDHNVKRSTSVKRAPKANDKQFRCYDPINLQSYFTSFWENTTEDELYNRFDIIGDMAQLGKSICAVSIRYTGYIPSVCNCTNQNGSHRQLKIAFDHGVQHHGATFNLTDEQSDKIAKLTELDSLLYERAKNVFAVQVKEIEDELNVVLCEDPDFDEVVKIRQKMKRKHDKENRRKKRNGRI